MAINSSRELSNGVAVDHWVIAGVQIDYLTGISKIILAGYLTKTAKDNKKATVIRKEYVCPGILGTSDDPRKEGYAFLKSLPEFSGAKDA